MAIIGLALLGVFVIFLISNLLIGLCTGLKKSVARLIAYVLSAIIAVVVTILVCSPSSSVMSTALGAVNELIAGTAVEELFAIDALGVSVSYYASMIVAPFVCMVLFMVISFILSIVAAIVIRCILREKKPGKALNRLGGTLTGLLCGFIVAVMILSPFVGIIRAATPALELDMVEESISDVKEITQSNEIKIMASLGCEPIYNVLASAKFDGERVYLKNEISAIVTVVDGLDALSVEMAEYGEDQIAAIESMLEGFNRSPLLKSTAAALLSEAASKWVDGESFADMEKPQTNEMIAPIVDGILGVISTSTKDNIEKDLETMKEVFAIMIRSEILKHSDDFSDMLSQLNKTNAISALFAVINENERMTVLSDEITNLSIRALASTIGVPEDENERYDLLMTELAGIISASYGKSDENRATDIQKDVQKALSDYGVEVSGEALAEVCKGLIADLGYKSTLTALDVEEFFMVYAIGSTQNQQAAVNSGYDLLAHDEPRFEIEADGTITFNGIVLQNYNSSNLRNSQAFRMGASGVDIDSASSLYSAESMESMLITMADLMATISKYGDCDNIAAESEKVGKILTRALEIFDEIDFDNVSATDLMSKLGEVLDMMQDSKIFGKEMTSNMLLAILQSEKIIGSLGISVAESTNFANKINEMVDGGKFDYRHATDVIADTVTVMESAGNSTNKTKEEKKEDAQKLLDTISKDTAEMIGTLVTPSLIENYGVSTEKSETVSSTVSSLLDNMANYENEDDVNGEQAAKEAEAVSTLLDLAITASDSNGGSLFNTKTDDGTGEGSGEGESTGSLNTTAAELVELVVTSEVVSTTIDDMVYRDGNDDNPFGAQLNEQDSAEAVTAIEEYYANNKGESAESAEELARKLEAVAIMLNVTVELEK